METFVSIDHCFKIQHERTMYKLQLMKNYAAILQ